MHAENLDRFATFLKEQGCQAALLSNPANITWLTGYAPPIQTGPAPWEGGPALAWYRGGELTLVLNDWEAPAAEALGVRTQPYAGYSLDGPLEGVRKQSEALLQALQADTGLAGKVAVERDFLPAAHYEMLKSSLSQARLIPIEGRLAPMRAVKTAEELQKVRRALHLSDVAQEEIQKHIRPGVSELELWGLVKNRVEMEAGGRTPVLADLVAGVRTADVGGLPGTYAVQPGDPVMLDFVGRLDGYFGDNSAGYFAGEPHPELEKAAQVARAALDAGRQAIRPGLISGDLDAMLRGFIRTAGYEPYPHHSGHGVGATFHEDPRIIPNYPMKLEPNMVLALEPGIYLPGVGGVRFEDVFLVTQDGCETLTTHLMNS